MSSEQTAGEPHRGLALAPEHSGEERSDAASDLAEVLSEFARTMLTDFPIQAILDHLVKRIVEIMPISAAGVTLISVDQDPRYVAASNGTALRFERLQSELAQGPCLLAYHEGEALAVPTLVDDSRFPEFSSQAVDGGLAAVFAFPLRHGEARLGALDLYRDTPGALSAADMGRAQTLADVAAAYLLNAQARSDLEQASDRSQKAALHDALTGLPNRSLVLERLEHAARRSRRSGKTTAVLFVDLDRFKEVNDAHGHAAGDELLIAVAQRLSAVLRPGDTVARLAGDEFLLLCEDLDERPEADRLATRIDNELRRPFTLTFGDVALTASLGIAFVAHAARTPEQLIHDADLAMYRVKRRRHGRRYDPDGHEPNLAEDQADLESMLRDAAARAELHLDYQPIVAAADGRLIAAEALLRWTHPTRGAVSPTVLIPLAERSELIVDIGQWVLEQAWSERAGWSGQAARDLGISVNVSARQLMSPGFADTVAAVLAGATTDPALLTLEVTESVLVRDSDRAAIVLNTLKNLGIKLALDDFGAGYASLSHLLRYPVDIIKVDRAFVADLGHHAISNTIMSAVVDLAHGLELTVIAEGVETLEQSCQLCRLGTDACQGFYFARPMSALMLSTLIRERADAHPTVLPLTR